VAAAAFRGALMLPPRPPAEEHRGANRAHGLTTIETRRCLSRHGAKRLVLILRHASTPVSIGGKISRTFLRMRTSPAQGIFTCQTAQLVPAARFLRPGFETLASRTPTKGWRSAESRTGACEAPVGLHLTRQARRLTRRLASHDAGRPPPGALTVAVFGSGAALPSPDLRPDRLRAPRVRVVVPGWRLSVPPGAAGASRYRRTPRLAPSSGSSLEHAL
jgi:hypothetical protein